MSELLPDPWPRWGQPGTNVLPSVVRDFAPGEADHAPLLEALGVDPAGGAGQKFVRPLREPVDAPGFYKALRGLLVQGLGALPAMGSAQAALVEAGPVAVAQAVPLLGWRERTRNAVLRACSQGPLSLHGVLLTSSVDDLLALPSFGALSLFDLLGAIEGAFPPDHHRHFPVRTLHRQVPGWGEPGSHVLPAVVRDHLRASGDGTTGLIEALRLLPETDPQGRLEHRVPEPFDPVAMRSALDVLLDEGLADQTALGSAWDSLAAISDEELALALPTLRLRTRTRNIVEREFGSLGLRDWLLKASVGDVLAVRQLGVVSLLDLLVGVEAAVEAVLAEDLTPRASSVSRSGPPAPPEKPALPEWASAVTSDDPRFRLVLGRAADLATLHEQAPPGTVQALEATLVEAEHILLELSGLTVEQEARSLLHAALQGTSDKWLDSLALRYGLSGEAPCTLEQVGLVMGVTRERVRQVQGKAGTRLPARPAFAPAADQALEMLEWTLPCSTQEFADALRAAGLSDVSSWSAAAFQATLALTGRTVVLEERAGLIGHPDQLRRVNEVVSAVKAVSNSHGTADAASVARRMGSEGEERPALSEINAVMRAMPGLTWVDGEGAWTEHAPGRNRLVNTSLRILAVITPQTLDDLLGGLEREYSFRASSNARYSDLVPPTRERLAAFYDSHPAFRRREDGLVEAVEPMPFDALGEEKQALVSVLRGQPYQAMDRLSLMEACDEIGMSSATVTVWTTYAECLKRFAPNVWGLRGAHVSDTEIARIRAAAQAVRRNTDRTSVSGTTPSGRPWVARRITPTFMYSGVMPFDWGRPSLIDRTLAAVDMNDGEQVGTLRFANNFNWGYSVFLRRQKAPAGGVLRVLADPAAGACYLELGGDELLSEPFDS